MCTQHLPKPCMEAQTAPKVTLPLLSKQTIHLPGKSLPAQLEAPPKVAAKPWSCSVVNKIHPPLLPSAAGLHKWWWISWLIPLAGCTSEGLFDSFSGRFSRAPQGLEAFGRSTSAASSPWRHSLRAAPLASLLPLSTEKGKGDLLTEV